MGVFHAKGWGSKSSCPPSKVCLSLGFEERNLGRPGTFAGMSRTFGGVQKVCAKKFVRIFHSLILRLGLSQNGFSF